MPGLSTLAEVLVATHKYAKQIGGSLSGRVFSNLRCPLLNLVILMDILLCKVSVYLSQAKVPDPDS